MGTKLTAVEWFEQKLDDLDIEIPQSIFEQAKEKFEQQIKDAFNDGINDECLGKNTTPEQYYNETFLKTE